MVQFNSVSWTRIRAVGLVAVVSLALVGPAEVLGYPYTIVKSQSQLNLTATGTAFGGALTVTEQFPDPPTPYTGSLNVQYPDGVFPGGSIAFPGESAASADVMRGGLFNTPRQVAPAVGGGAGTAPANYGLTFVAPVEYVLPPIPYPDANNPISLGTLQSITVKLALRDLVLDVDSISPMALDSSSQFDATGTTIGITSGYADINGAAVLHQTNPLTALALYAVLQGLVASQPSLGLSVSLDLLNSNVNLGIGTRVDLSTVPDFLSIGNTTTTLGTVAFNPVSQYSTLTLPITLDLPDFGLPTAILDLDMRLNGQLVATATLPEPTTLMLVGLPLAGLLRRRK